MRAKTFSKKTHPLVTTCRFKTSDYDNHLNFIKILKMYAQKHQNAYNSALLYYIEHFP